MSFMSRLYGETLEEAGEALVEAIKKVVPDGMSEREKCLELGEPCSYGICDECPNVIGKEVD